MSGTATPLLDAECTDIRRFCGYPVLGGNVLSGAYAVGRSSLLEYRMASLSDAELGVVRSYLATLAGLEAALPAAAANLDTDQASVWTRNRTEVQDRTRLLAMWSRRLCSFLGVMHGPGLLPDASVPLVV